MKKKMVVIIVLLMLVSFAGCGSKSIDNPLDAAEQPQNSNVVLIENSDRHDKPLQFDSVEDVIENQNETFFKESNEFDDWLGQNLGDFFYIYNGQYFVDTRDFAATSPSDSDENKPVITLLDETDFPVIDRDAGDQLVLIVSDYINEKVRWNQPIDSAYPIHKLTFEGYCIPIVWENGQPALLLMAADYFGGMGYHVDEINSINIYYDDPETFPITYDPDDQIRKELFFDAIADIGLTTYDFTIWALYKELEGSIILGNLGDTISFGKYSGTEYHEFIVPFDARLYSGVSNCELTPMRTRDGYLLYDLSQLEPGLYSFMNKVFCVR